MALFCFKIDWFKQYRQPVHQSEARKIIIVTSQLKYNEVRLPAHLGPALDVYLRNPNPKKASKNVIPFLF